MVLGIGHLILVCKNKFLILNKYVYGRKFILKLHYFFEVFFLKLRLILKRYLQ